MRPVFDVDGLAGEAGSSLHSRMTGALGAHDEVRNARSSARSATIRRGGGKGDIPIFLNRNVPFSLLRTNPSQCVLPPKMSPIPAVGFQA